MTNPIFTQTYSSKSVAKRGAGRANLEEGTFTIEAIDGRFQIVPVVAQPQETPVEAFIPPVVNFDAVDVYPEVKIVDLLPEVKSPALKTIATTARSAVLKPVEFVHAFLDAAEPMTRKAAIQTLVELGVNYSTARTQYQRWFTINKGK